jgi:hypothetical protein
VEGAQRGAGRLRGVLSESERGGFLSDLSDTQRL